LELRRSQDNRRNHASPLSSGPFSSSVPFYIGVPFFASEIPEAPELKNKKSGGPVQAPKKEKENASKKKRKKIASKNKEKNEFEEPAA
jgi:hypothetical protein